MTVNYTIQETFDKVCEGLKKQRWKKSVGTDGSCLYRGPGDLKCAIGQLLPDEDYRSDFDRANLGPRAVAQHSVALQKHDMRFMISLQSLHDMAPDGESLKDRFECFALDKLLEWKHD